MSSTATRHDIAEAVRDADMVFLAVPLGAMRDAFAAMREALAGACAGHRRRQRQGQRGGRLSRGRTRAVAAIRARSSDCRYREQRCGGLLRRVVPEPAGDPDPAGGKHAQPAVARVRAMWETCGAEVTEMSVAHHDEVLAATSHLPHMLAFGLVDMLARMKENDEIFRYAAGGFRDFTRIASSNPVMWRDICIANREALGPMLAAFADEMSELADTHRGGRWR